MRFGLILFILLFGSNTDWMFGSSNTDWMFGNTQIRTNRKVIFTSSELLLQNVNKFTLYFSEVEIFCKEKITQFRI